MGLTNIILRDNRNKKYQKINQIREETELLIYNNINVLNKEDPFLTISSIEFNQPTVDLDNSGWKEEDGLYDELIIEYNNNPNSSGLLKMWI